MLQLFSRMRLELWTKTEAIIPHFKERALRVYIWGKIFMAKLAMLPFTTWCNNHSLGKLFTSKNGKNIFLNIPETSSSDPATSKTIKSKRMAHKNKAFSTASLHWAIKSWTLQGKTISWLHNTRTIKAFWQGKTINNLNQIKWFFSKDSPSLQANRQHKKLIFSQTYNPQQNSQCKFQFKVHWLETKRWWKETI